MIGLLNLFFTFVSYSIEKSTDYSEKAAKPFEKSFRFSPNQPDSVLFYIKKAELYYDTAS